MWCNSEFHVAAGLAAEFFVLGSRENRALNATLLWRLHLIILGSIVLAACRSWGRGPAGALLLGF